MAQVATTSDLLVAGRAVVGGGADPAASQFQDVHGLTSRLDELVLGVGLVDRRACDLTGLGLRQAAVPQSFLGARKRAELPRCLQGVDRRTETRAGLAS